MRNTMYCRWQYVVFFLVVKEELIGYNTRYCVNGFRSFLLNEVCFKRSFKVRGYSNSVP